MGCDAKTRVKLMHDTVMLDDITSKLLQKQAKEIKEQKELIDYLLEENKGLKSHISILESTN